MLPNCSIAKIHSRISARKINKNERGFGKPEILGNRCLEPTAVDNQSAAKKFSAFYGHPSQLADLDSLLGTRWHLFGLLCPSSFLISTSKPVLEPPSHPSQRPPPDDRMPPSLLFLPLFKLADDQHGLKSVFWRGLNDAGANTVR